MFYIGVVVTILAICYCMRIIAERRQKRNVERPLGNSRIILTKLHNAGLAESRLQDRPEIVKIMATAAVVLIAIAFLIRLPMRGKKAMKLGLAFVLGGGLANLLERYRYGYITDYVKFDVPFRRIRRLVFNIADFCIFIGAVITAISTCVDKEGERS